MMFARISLLLIVLLAAGLAAVRWGYYQHESFPDLSGAPLLPSTELETVAELPYPPGNIAVSVENRVFFTFHPEAGPEINVAELRKIPGEADQVVAFPDASWQPGSGKDGALNEVLSLRLFNNELWLLDNGKHGLESVRLLAFDINNGELLQQYTFPRDVFPLGSHANDFRISPDGRYFYITDASLLAQTPALVVFDRQEQDSWRVLHKSHTVTAGDYQPVVQGRAMSLFGVFTVNPGVDGIALDAAGEWLYFAAISAEQLYRVRTADLHDHTLPYATLESRVEALGAKTMTDGMAIDATGNVYLSDLEHSAIVRRRPDGELQTLLRSADLRWPDGFSLAEDGYLYVTCSALHQVIGIPRDEMLARAPFQIYRFHLGRAEQLLNNDG
ncbi:major royal jelly family protein [Bacterioplanoides sp. SCSIO 12839]|uniref:major royal jelly family protein n=1 Tax=Bacterioplanoides sp. SCSIO 12839 TaxID=2829569 RepID=UPI0021038F52|nr:major royal jelly family protein [Bacterioplanoides sp. SCSIO 12839]UTW47276.1 SMP-30/gluconolactonase/LRE family protein [Bacterioplanoides sp. SCSIO 12839]